ncbi:MAG: ATP-binding protein [Planctomycetes bacterium]|nr:ATP-binding protein [Planctomycetota bacterium]
MIRRELWLKKIHDVWSKAPIAWLAGVRRVGKTTLCRSIADAAYLNCDLPSTVELLKDPERFYASVSKPIVIFDEIHQLHDPSRILKIGADAFPSLKLLATGSSTLAATEKFRDSLAGRKRTVHLLPVIAEELAAFGVIDLKKRLFHGGLPQALLSEERDSEFYAEWLDSYYARDIQELFRVEKRKGFILLLETLLRQSGGLIEATNLAKICGLSRPTVLNYLEVLQVTHAIRLLRPYHHGGRQELLQQPKVYGFDTGFAAFYRGWGELRIDDCGLLWEHLVLDTLSSLSGSEAIHFWRDKQKREVDFVIPRSRGACDAFECKWDAASFEVKGLAEFRSNYPKGRNFVVSPQAMAPYSRDMLGMDITFSHASDLRWLMVSPR